MTQSKQRWQCRVIDGKHVVDSEMVVYRFQIPWSEDAVVSAGAPLYDWEQSDAGKWVRAHAVETPRWERFLDNSTFNERFAVIARLTDQDQTYFRLKYE